MKKKLARKNSTRLGSSTHATQKPTKKIQKKNNEKKSGQEKLNPSGQLYPRYPKTQKKIQKFWRSTSPGATCEKTQKK